jgi:hypothetical protein
LPSRLAQTEAGWICKGRWVANFMVAIQTAWRFITKKSNHAQTHRCRGDLDRFHVDIQLQLWIHYSHHQFILLSTHHWYSFNSWGCHRKLPPSQLGSCIQKHCYKNRDCNQVGERKCCNLALPIQLHSGLVLDTPHWHIASYCVHRLPQDINSVQSLCFVSNSRFPSNQTDKWHCPLCHRFIC